MNSLKYGATIYFSPLRRDLEDIGNGVKYQNLRSIVFCTENLIIERDLPKALESLKRLITKFEPGGPFKFIRPRTPEVLSYILKFRNIEGITGFVIPKADCISLPAYFEALVNCDKFEIIVTLETEVAFQLRELYRLRDYLLGSRIRPRISAICIGTAFLFSILSLKRDISKSIYETPIGHTIDRLINVFKPSGFDLTAPCYDDMNNIDILNLEISLDINRGLFSKIASHPCQIDTINSAYQVSEEELEMAKAIFDPRNPAVFRQADRMCEKAVHANWARIVLERARLFGVKSMVPGHCRDLSILS
ncbi:MAG: HpcH/HpaI aldolase/citrate lyase family protein [Deltaproteobacteria bacterium]|jgi:citrate lyase beta subunit|nr:HpcH/HpaI aldolase/citrate lyase family protein [Deltaproteobacteria bacterium]